MKKSNHIAVYSFRFLSFQYTNIHIRNLLLHTIYETILDVALPKPHTLLIKTIQTCGIMIGICAASSDLNGWSAVVNYYKLVLLI